jgi:hypothetical protein
MEVEARAMTPPTFAPGDRVRFAPNPRWPDRKIEARIVRFRDSRHFQDARCAHSTLGWIDTVDDADFERSVRPSRCELVQRTTEEESAHG